MPNETNNNINNNIPINTQSIQQDTVMNNLGMQLTKDLKSDRHATLLARVMEWCLEFEYEKWTNLLTMERNLYDVLNIQQIGYDLPPDPIDEKSRVKALKRYTGELLDGDSADYLKDQLPVFFSLLYCHSTAIDELRIPPGGTRRGEGMPVTNVFYKRLKQFLNSFLVKHLGKDNAKMIKILESNDDEILLAVFITIFNYEELLSSNEDETEVFKKLKYVIDEEIYKKRYFECLIELTRKNEVNDENIDRDLFIDRYYVLPNIEPKLCNHHNDTINALITCSPGYGKTSACRAIIAACLCEEAKSLHDEIKKQWLGNKDPKELFPIYIEATNIDYYVNHNKELPNSLIDLVFVKDEKRHTNAVKVIKKQLGESGCGRNLLLILDGLDEAMLEHRNNLTQLVKSFRNTYTEANIILTSRPINFDSYNYDETNEKTDAITGLTMHRLSIIEKKKRIAIVNKWACILGQEPVWAANTERTVSNNPYLSSLAKNPFLLAHMVLKIAENKEKPYDIIYKVVENLIEKRRIANDTDFGMARLLLSYIAYNLIINKRNNIPHCELEDMVSESEIQARINREEWKRLSEEIITKSGLMICDYKKDKKVYYFQEPIIQKFLAAEWLLRNFMHTYMYKTKKDDKNPDQPLYIYKDNPDLFYMEQIKPKLDDMWKKTDPQTWTDGVMMMMIKPPTEGGWRDDFSDIVIEPIFTYLLQTNATSVEPKQIESICKILKAMCLEEFSTSELLMNEDVEEVRNNRIRLLRTLLSGIPGYYEKCCRVWEAESKSIQNFYSANETEVK